MKVENMTNSRGNKVANQFVITDEGRGALGNFISRRTFQSYDTVIAVVIVWPDASSPIEVKLDADAWDYSVTTSRYRNQFLGETTAQTRAKIASGEYTLVDLNGGD